MKRSLFPRNLSTPEEFTMNQLPKLTAPRAIAAWISACAFLAAFTGKSLANPQVPPQEITEYRGNLGGAPISIRTKTPYLILYEADDSRPEAAAVHAKPRTWDSKILQLMWHSKLPRETIEAGEIFRNDKTGGSRQSNSRLRIQVDSGGLYAGDDVLVKFIRRMTLPDPLRWNLHYVASGPEIHGLVRHELAGFDPLTRMAFQDHSAALEIYIYRDQHQQPATAISCAAHGPAPQCEQVWLMTAHGMKATVTVNYDKELLHLWRQIQLLQTEDLLSLRIRLPGIDTKPAHPLPLMRGSGPAVEPGTRREDSRKWAPA